MIANTLVYSRFRYALNSEAIPTSMDQDIESDVDAIVWGKEVEFEADKRKRKRKRKRKLDSGVDSSACDGSASCEWLAATAVKQKWRWLWQQSTDIGSVGDAAKSNR